MSSFKLVDDGYKALINAIFGIKCLRFLVVLVVYGLIRGEPINEIRSHFGVGDDVLVCI